MWITLVLQCPGFSKCERLTQSQADAITFPIHRKEPTEIFWKVAKG